MAERLTITQFLEEYTSLPVIDVRSPAEYKHGHIPGAISLPLFTDEERAIVGKAYHLRGREDAVREGLTAVGPKMQDFVGQALQNAPGGNVLVYCWRGGMRSASIAFLLETAGMKARTLDKGYKAYRQHVLQHFNRTYRFVVLGGMTGSGKTEMLQALKEEGEQVIDLEGIANHKGSAFGHLGMSEQPTTEHFENMLCETLQGIDPSRPCWIEDESFKVGNVSLPMGLYRQIRTSTTMIIELPRPLRARRLIAEYPDSVEELKNAVELLYKRLGHKRKDEILHKLENRELFEAALLLLEYYDTLYQYGIDKRQEGTVTRLSSESPDPYANARMIKNKYYNI
jgi:tRNA 2-selenouridine synthase